jgi:hypothetical protein
MSNKSTTFVPTYLKSPQRQTNREVRQTRKTGSYAPPAHQWPLGDVLAHRTSTAPAENINVALNLTEAVALVSATLAAADHALVQAARWETLQDENRSQLMYARSVMLEALAEKFARASRNTNEDKR